MLQSSIDGVTVGLQVSGLQDGNTKNYNSYVADADENSKPVDARAREFQDSLFFSFVLPLFRTKSFPGIIRDSRCTSPGPCPGPCPFAGVGQGKGGWNYGRE